MRQHTIVPTGEKAVPVAAGYAVPKIKLVVVELPKECKAYFMDSTIWVSDSSFRVVSSDGRKSPILSIHIMRHTKHVRKHLCQY